MTFSNSINWVRRDGPRWENLGITLSAGVFKVTSSDGTALSQSNAAYVTIPSRANPGQQKVFRVIADQSFQDVNGTNTLGNSLFGLTSNVAYAADLPFFIYAAADSSDANLTFFITRIPHVTVCPVAGNIGQSGNTLASTQGSFFALQAVTAANFAGMPCICMGAFRMRYTSAASPWTVQTLTDGSASSTNLTQADGIGCFHEGTKFVMATGQFGAASGKWFNNNGGTAPAWSTQAMSFTINKTGSVRIDSLNLTSSAGTGAQIAQLALPYNRLSGGCLGVAAPSGFLGISVTSTAIGLQNVAFQATTTGTGALTNLTNAQLAVASFEFSLIWQADVA